MSEAAAMTQIVRIDKKIVACRAVPKAQAQGQPQTQAEQPKQAEQKSNVVQMNESVERPNELEGKTYKINSPAIDSALYVTINDIVLNKGSNHELRRPYEIFVNTKDVTSYHWITALTRLMSAVFRKGGDVTFLVDELKAVFDPKGGYFQQGTGMFVPSAIAEIGMVIEKHLVSIGLIKVAGVIAPVAPEDQIKRDTTATGGLGPFMAYCGKCNNHSVIKSEGCETCTNCGYSKCG